MITALDEPMENSYMTGTPPEKANSDAFIETFFQDFRFCLTPSSPAKSGATAG